jgi:hypothetical protein
MGTIPQTNETEQDRVTDARIPNDNLRKIKSVMTLIGLTLLFALRIVGLVLIKDAKWFLPIARLLFGPN